MLYKYNFITKAIFISLLLLSNVLIPKAISFNGKNINPQKLSTMSESDILSLITPTIDSVDETNVSSYVNYSPQLFIIFIKAKNVKQIKNVVHSLKHLERIHKHQNTLCYNPIIALFSSPQLFDALGKEQELLESGYSIFYHGQNNMWGLVQDFTTELINALAQHNICKPLRQDFFYIQNPNNLLKPDLPISSSVIKEQQQMVRDGRTEQPYRKKYRLGVNAFLFGCCTISGSCTWDFINHNFNIDTRYQTIDFEQYIFNPMNISSSKVSQFSHQLKQLEQTHKSLFKQGRLLQIAIPFSKVNEYTHLAGTYGNKRTLQLNNGQTITLPSEFLDIVKNSPHFMDDFTFDNSEFALVLTRASVLNPNHDVKVFGYNSYVKDKKALARYEKQRKQLTIDIAKACAKK